MFQRLCLSILLGVGTLTASAASAQSSVDLPQELGPRALLLGIMKALDTTVADPRSVTDVVLCPATRVRYGADGRPQSWYVAFSMNARTAAGGFAGHTMYGAAFRVGRRTMMIRAQAATDDGFDRLINNAIRKQMRDCPRVPNDQLADLVGASDRPTVDVSR